LQSSALTSPGPERGVAEAYREAMPSSNTHLRGWKSWWKPRHAKSWSG